MRGNCCLLNLTSTFTSEVALVTKTDSSEKVSFRVDTCNVLPCELRLFWYSTGVLNRHLANKLNYRHVANSRPTNSQQSADCAQKIFVKGSKRQLANSWLLTNSRQAESFLGAVLHFFCWASQFSNVNAIQTSLWKKSRCGIILAISELCRELGQVSNWN